MLKIIICGINGKMGNFIYENALKRSHSVICGIDKSTVGFTECPVYADFEQIKYLSDVIIDFSSPSALPYLLDYATANKLPLVIGTTGYTEEQEKLILEASKLVPIFKSANMSLGINLLVKLCKTANISLKGYDLEITEFHHKNKKDSPSGTANLIYQSLAPTFPSPKTLTYGRKGNSKRKDGEVGIHSIRGGSTVGKHTVYFFGENESISISHEAHSKELFAEGAIKASEFIVTKNAGLYGMNDLIEI